MGIDLNAFFRESTLKICGNLNIEQAMSAFLGFVQKHIPVDRLFLQCYIKEQGVMRTIVDATPEKGKRIDILIPLSKASIKHLKNIYKKGTPKPYFYEKPHEVVSANEILTFHKIKAKSILIMHLGTASEFVGSVVLVSKRFQYNQGHLDLMTLLKDPFLVAVSNALQHREVIKLMEIIDDENRYLKDELKRITGEHIIGSEFGLKDVMEKANVAALFNSPILLLGETGTGKDVIANAIHYSSHRKDGPFVKVNCGAIPESLVDSELFGHEKGSFTGAHAQKRGKFERADKGTIFLDEIGELALDVQVRLLRVLQEKEIERVGGVETIPLDIRIIAATNCDMEKMVRLKKFREDLWFRINVFPINVPPLRERKLDIPALVNHFITIKVKELKLPEIPPLAPGAIESLMEYDWPGNVRELQNIVERALMLSSKEGLSFNFLNLKSLTKVTETVKNNPGSNNLDEVVAQHIKSILSKTNGKISGSGGAAEMLGINPNTLHNRMKKLGIK
jgi:transcriptional regulator with GAF, ATPase, and Fis domain